MEKPLIWFILSGISSITLNTALNELFQLNFIPSLHLVPLISGIKIQRGECKLQNQKDIDIPSPALTEYMTEGKLMTLRLSFFICKSGTNYAYIMDQDWKAPGIPPTLSAPPHSWILSFTKEQKGFGPLILHKKTKATTSSKSYH